MVMNERLPGMRRDLEFFPVMHGGERLILIRDHLGLVQEGKAIPVPVYQLMTLLDGAMSIVELQTYLIRQGGGVLVGSEEIRTFITRLDDSFLLDSDGFRKARNRIIDVFAAEPVRECSHMGGGYPAGPDELRIKLDEILSSGADAPVGDGVIRAIVSPHIDLAIGRKGYANAYHTIAASRPQRIILLGWGTG